MGNKKRRTFAQALPARLRRVRKWAWQRLRARPAQPKTVLFIIGSQRSGTSVMARIFDQDPNSHVFGEGSREVTCGPGAGQRRLRPFPEVQQVINRTAAPLVILKPLVESQNALALLDAFPGARALWMYRHYRDVTNSKLAKWGPTNGVRSLRAIAQGATHNWRAEQMPAGLRQMVLEHYSEAMSPYDAAALAWVVRNALFFEQELERHPAVRLCQYESLVARPAETMASVYAALGRPFPGPQLTREIHTSARGKGRDIPLSPEAEALCEALLQRLDCAFTYQAGPPGQAGA